jgi:predicted nucleic acid-binding protein
MEGEIRKLTVYLDTSVINFLFAEDAPEFQRATKRFFEICSARFDVCMSDAVTAELSRTPDAAHRSALLDAAVRIGARLLSVTAHPEILTMSNRYMEEGVIPRTKIMDAVHLAVCTVHGVDILLSWNSRHLANIRKQDLVNAVNAKAGYRKPLRLLNPLEVLYDDSEG